MLELYPNSQLLCNRCVATIYSFRTCKKTAKLFAIKCNFKVNLNFKLNANKACHRQPGQRTAECSVSLYLFPRSRSLSQSQTISKCCKLGKGTGLLLLNYNGHIDSAPRNWISSIRHVGHHIKNYAYVACDRTEQDRTEQKASSAPAAQQHLQMTPQWYG